MRVSGVVRRCVVAALSAMAVVMPTGTHAQYFGRNKVEYVDFDFRILSTDHFDFYFYPREERATRIAARLAERWYARFAAVLDHQLTHRQPVILYGSQAEFAQTNVVPGLLSDSIGGVTESNRRRIVLPFAPTLAETERVLGHELAHAFQFDLARRYGGGMDQPLWFVEGMAEYLARGANDSEARLWLRDAVRSDRIPRKEPDAARRLSPYQYGHAFWSYLAERFGDDVVARSLKSGKRRKFQERMRLATGVELSELFDDWRAAAMAAPRLAVTPTQVLSVPTDAGRMQVGPALSPDGRTAAVFSERDGLALDLFLTDVATGRVIRKLATTTASARFDSLQPLRSAGAWSANGEWFAFAAVRQGQAALVLLNMRQAGADREIPLERLGQIFSPTWSPDGEAIAFSALSGGFTDLYRYELTANHLQQLTDDAFADLHPAWSPDGRTIAFATERFSSDLGSLTFGRTALAAIDVATGDVRPIPLAGRAAATNPQWAPDGRSIYFVANTEGVSDVFNVELTSLACRRITHVESVSGMTPTSPAISFARDSHVLAFTRVQDGRPQLAVLSGSAALAGELMAVGANLDVEPRVDGGAPSGMLQRLLTDDREGLPADLLGDAHDYAPRLSLERLGQPYVSSGGGPLGTFVRAGGSLSFGDMLGERRLGAAVQVGNRLRDAAFEVRYLNQERRWNWGALADLEPSLRRYRRRAEIDRDGQAATLKQSDYLQRVQLRTAAVAAYPFNRGLRVELTAGVRHAAYSREVRSQISARDSGRILETGSVSSSAGAPTTVGEISAALVGDTTVFGPTGPLLGSRYRFEIAPAAGGLSYTRVLVDYRRYVMPIRPLAIALRMVHSGRFGPDGGDPRLLASFLGSQYLVRGHLQDMQRCRATIDRACGDELLGSQILVGNLEVRFPIWGLRSRELRYGPLPADGFLFADGGLVWSRDADLSASAASRLGRQRHGISSIGAGVRLNAGGLPVELAAIRALDGPAPRWLFDLGFRVGF